MASGHAEEMARRCTGGKAPRLAQHFYRHVRDSDGHLTLKYWSGADSSVAPLYSFQFYVTYDMSGAADSELEALARELMCRIPDSTRDPGAIHARLDVHFLGRGASTDDCVAHYRRFKDNPPNGPSMRIIPSYFSESYCHHHCLFFKIEDPNWKDDQIGLKRVEFDHRDSGRPNVEQEKITTGEAAALCGDVYLMPHHDGNFRDECERLYQAAVKAGLNEWTSDPFSGPVDLMDTSPVDIMTSPAALPPRQSNLDRHFRHLQAHDGHLVLTVWAGYSLPPLYSFQFYVTYDISGVDNSGFEALARRLHIRILDDDMASKPIRFDVHIVGPQATIDDCIALYRHSKETPSSDPSTRIVASYNRDDEWSYHSHLLIISKSKWEDRVGGGMRRVSFDPVESKRVANHRPTLKRWSALHQVSGFCKDVYESVGTPAGRIREECEAAYDAAKEKGLTEW